MDLLPHIKAILDDVLTMTSDMVVKIEQYANSAETAESLLAYDYYYSVINGYDSFNSYEKYPYALLRDLSEWQSDHLRTLPKIREPDINKINPDTGILQPIVMSDGSSSCYISTSEPSDSLGKLGDAYLKVESSEMYEITELYKYDYDINKYVIDENGDYFKYKDSYYENAHYVRYSKDGDSYIEDPDGIYAFVYIGEPYSRRRCFDSNLLIMITNNNKYIPEEYRDKVLAAMRTKVLSEYCTQQANSDYSVAIYGGEINAYYRELNGLPPVNDTTYIPQVAKSTIYTLGPDEEDKNLTVHLMNDYEISVLKDKGILDNLIETYPSKEYLKHLGTSRIDVMEARAAENFDILKIGKYLNIQYYTDFCEKYKIAKEYILRKHYFPEMFGYEQYYTAYIGYMIVVQAMMLCISANNDVLFYDKYNDEETIRLKLKSYGLNKFDDIPLMYRKNIAKNIIRLRNAKGTDDIYDLVAEIFGVSNMEVYKYFYVKTNGNLGILKTPIGGDAYNNYEEKNILDYNEITQADALWGAYGFNNSDDPMKEIRDKLMSMRFNAMNTKYISISNKFNLTKLSFDSAYMMNFLMDYSKGNSKLNYYIDGLTTSNPLFDLLITLYQIQSLRFGFDGNIPHGIISTAAVYRYNLNDYIDLNGTQVKILDIFKQFEYSYNEYANDVLGHYPRVKSDWDTVKDNAANLLKLIKPKNIPATIDEITTACDANSSSKSALYDDGVYYKLIQMKQDAKSYKEYMCYEYLTKCIATSMLVSENFRLPESVWYKDYERYIWHEINDVDEDDDNLEIYECYGYPSERVLNDDVYIAKCIFKDTLNNKYYEKVKNTSIAIVGDVSPDQHTFEAGQDAVGNYYLDTSTNTVYYRTDIALTYDMYLEHVNPVLHKDLQIKKGEKQKAYFDRLGEIYNTILETIESGIYNGSIKEAFAASNKDADLICTYMIKVINVFKSYSIKIMSIDSEYELDDRYETINMFDDMRDHMEDYVYQVMFLPDMVSTDVDESHFDTLRLREEIDFLEEKVKKGDNKI